MRERAFTLIELLVVLAIVGILAGLLCAAAQRSKAEGDAAHCVSNLRQWGAALALYVNDHQGYLPRRGQGVRQLAQIDHPTDWFNALPPYMGMASFQSAVTGSNAPEPGDNSVFVCPSAVRAGGSYFLPYGMNMYLSPWDEQNADKLSTIPAPDQLAFLADAPGQYSSTVPSSLAYSVMPRHMGRANVCFVDGHVASYDGTYLGCGMGQPALPDIRWPTLIPNGSTQTYP